MKKIFLCAVACCGLLFSGCSIVEDVLAMFKTPEEVVKDYTGHISKILESDQSCGEKAEALDEYCGRSSKRVSKAVREFFESQLNDAGSDASQKRLNDFIESQADAIGSIAMNGGKCLIHPGLTSAMVKCVEPLKNGVANAL